MSHCLTYSILQQRVRIRGVKYGYIYNPVSLPKLSGTGWHVPTYKELDNLITWLTDNGYGYEGSGNDVAKSVSFTSGWDSSLTPGTPGNNQSLNNSAKFSGRAGGARNLNGSFVEFGTTAIFHALPLVSTLCYYRRLYYNQLTFSGSGRSNGGRYVRLLKDSTTLSHGEIGEYVGNDERKYPTICIGLQEWLSVNLAETKDSDGNLIPTVTGSTEWSNLTTPGKCAYNNNESLVFL